MLGLNSADMANVLMTAEICTTVAIGVYMFCAATAVGICAVSWACTKVFPNLKLPDIKMPF